MIQPKKPYYSLLLLASLTGCAADDTSNKDVDKDSSTTEPTATTPPNIVVILLDDVGYSDYGCYGSEVPTPNIDRLAANGIRLQHFYNHARSGPSRASIMTGLYAHQAGYGSLKLVPESPNYQGHRTDNALFIPEVLESKSYYSFMTGKWHLGTGFGVRPIASGFNRSLDCGAGEIYFSDSSKKSLYLNDSQIDLKSDLLPNAGQWYSPYLWTDMGLRFVDEAIEKDRPFFWYLAHNGAHFPLQAPEATIAKYKGRYSQGWDEVRNKRFEKQKQLGLFGADTKITPRNPMVPEWDSLTDKQKDQYDTQMAIYAAIIEEIDASIGRLLDELEKRGVLDNTVIMLLNDNGGNGEPGIEGKFALNGDRAGGVKSSIFLGAAWADVANTPYFLYKHHGHEGGCNTPFIISYPAGIDKALNGSINKEYYGHTSDIMATIVDLSGAKYPAIRDGHSITPMEGKSLSQLFKGKTIAPRPIIMEHEGNKMLRFGDYKLVKEYEKVETEWRLYNLREDPTELNNIAGNNSSILNMMVEKYNSVADHIGVDPSYDNLWNVGKWYTPIDNYFKE